MIKTKNSLLRNRAMVEINSLIKGIDNSAIAINKHKTNVEINISRIREVLSGLSDTSQVKKSQVKKSQVKKSQVKKSSTKPKIKDAIIKCITNNDEPMLKITIYNEIINKYGNWSKQYFYNALKDKKLFKDVGGKIKMVKN